MFTFSSFLSCEQGNKYTYMWLWAKHCVNCNPERNFQSQSYKWPNASHDIWIAMGSEMRNWRIWLKKTMKTPLLNLDKLLQFLLTLLILKSIIMWTNLSIWFGIGLRIYLVHCSFSLYGSSISDSSLCHLFHRCKYMIVHAWGL